MRKASCYVLLRGQLELTELMVKMKSALKTR